MFVIVRNPYKRTTLKVDSLSGMVNKEPVARTFPGEGLSGQNIENPSSVDMTNDLERNKG